MILAFLVFILSCNILPWNWDLVTFKKFFAFKNFLNIFYITRASLVTQMVKNPLAMWETGFDPWVGKIPGGRRGNPLQYSCLENPHEQRNLVGYTPWGGKESDITERLSTAHTTFKGNFPFTVIRKYWLFPPLKKKKHLFIWLCWVLTATCRGWAWVPCIVSVEFSPLDHKRCPFPLWGTIYPWDYLTPSNLHLPLPHSYVALPPPHW